MKAARQRLEKEVPGCSVDGIASRVDRLADGYRRSDVLELPVAVKLATALKLDPG